MPTEKKSLCSMCSRRISIRPANLPPTLRMCCIQGTSWNFLSRMDGRRAIDFLAAYVNDKQAVIDGCSDRISAADMAERPRRRSLELVEPEDLWWWIREDKGKRKNRALFRLGNDSRVRYDLAVTDPVWLNQLNLLSAGIYTHAFLLGGKNLRTFLTFSLSEPFEDYHYKLVAGVVIPSA